MPIVNTVAIAGQSYEIHATQGDVIEEHKMATSEVTGGGTSNVPITSRTDIHHELILKLADGSELPVQLQNANLVLRKGHRLTMFSVYKAGESTGGQYVAVKNHVTRDTNMLPRGVQKITGLGNLTAIAAIGALVVGIGLAIAAIAGRFSSPQAGLLETLFLLLCGLALAWFGFRPVRAAFQRNQGLQAAVGAAVQAAV